MIVQFVFAQGFRQDHGSALGIERESFSIVCVRTVRNMCDDFEGIYYDILYVTDENIMKAWDRAIKYCDPSKDCVSILCQPVSFVYRLEKRKREISCYCSYKTPDGQCHNVGDFSLGGNEEENASSWINSLIRLSTMCKAVLESQDIPDSDLFFFHNCQI